MLVDTSKSPPPAPSDESPIAQGSKTYLALHTLGWKAFQDLCAQICEEVLQKAVSVYREAQDGGQDAAFTSQSKAAGKAQLQGTIQCKFVGDPMRRLKASDIATERENIQSLVAAGLANSYYFITNMGVDAQVAAAMRSELQSLGVQEPEVFGLEWITLKVRESARLRALVPRIYGLGDLSIILEERRAQQTQALLGHLMPAMRTYVPTAAHRQAVRILSDAGIVLLVGAPAAGKSMIAAILATTVLDSESHRCFQLDGPSELSDLWNPNETGRFYWIDDAFGPSQIRDDYVDSWISIMGKVKTAISLGNRFVLTSRTPIWRAAKVRLGTRNHQKLDDGSAVVNVGELSPDERAQILYNHVKEGNQSSQWKGGLVPHMDAVARSSGLLPEIARRLGDKSYTQSIRLIPDDVIAFISRPIQFLKDTLNELNDAQRAALTVIFLYRSRFPSHIVNDDRISRVIAKFGVSYGDISLALIQLDGSFVFQKPDGAGRVWTFAHPTIADALAEILRDRPDLLELYVLGARPEELLAEVVCDGRTSIKDAIIVPQSIDDLLATRILEVADEPSLNKALFSFLSERASDELLRDIVKKSPEILHRQSDHYWRVWHDGRLNLFARLHEMRLLPDALKIEAAEEMEYALFNRLDASLLVNDRLMALIEPSNLLQLSIKFYNFLIEETPKQIEEIVNGADLDREPVDNFEDLKSYLSDVGSAFFMVQQVTDAIASFDTAIEVAATRIAEKIALKKKEPPPDWGDIDIAPKVITASSKSRSIFSDLNQ